MRDELRERLAGIRPGRWRGVVGRPGRPSADLAGIGDVSSEDGVLVVERGLADFASREVVDALLSRLAGARRSAAQRGDVDEEVRAFIADPAGALFVDAETTGLSGGMVFLLGLMRIGGGDVRITQVFARDYREEPALLSRWIGALEAAGLLVSFNGKSFDLPMLRDRLAFHGLESPPEPPHLDLLHHARRRWRDVLPDCRLQTLEWRVSGRRRAGDIPGEEIPGVYHHFVRTGDVRDIFSVFHHNALDLVTLVDIVLALAVPEGGPV